MKAFQFVNFFSKYDGMARVLFSGKLLHLIKLLKSSPDDITRKCAQYYVIFPLPKTQYLPW